MDLILEDKNKRTINTKEEIVFSSFSSWHLVTITARAKGEKQLKSGSTDDEDLTVEIDGKVFPKLGTKNALIDSPASFNGGKLHNLSQTIYFLTFLKGRDHKIILNADKPPSTATFESVDVYATDLTEQLILNIGKQAEDGDRRPWLTFVLDNLSLKSFSPSITYYRRFMDSDDVRIISDGKTHTSLSRELKHLFWFFVGSLIPKLSFKTENEKFLVSLPPELHYIEFYADRMPILHHLILDFGTKASVPEGIPTVESPKWTEDFSDDTTEILLARLIFGEAENQSKEAKIGVGFTVINRVKKKKSGWGYTVRDVILKDQQYDGLWNDKTKDKVRDPLNKATDKVKNEWLESYNVAVSILSGTVLDTSLGATNFHSFKRREEFPPWAQDRYYKTKLDDIYFYELES